MAHYYTQLRAAGVRPIRAIAGARYLAKVGAPHYLCWVAVELLAMTPHQFARFARESK